MSYTSGTASDEQDLVDQISSFLTGTCGWTLLDTVTDDVDDNDRVFVSSPTDGRRTAYIRWRGTSNYLYVFGYTLWVNSGQYNDQMHNTTNSRAFTGSGSIPYWLFGDPDRLIVVIKNGTAYYSLYGGFMNSYYTTADDDLPLCVIGHNSESYRLSDTRALMYVPFNVSSGTSTYYHAHYDIVDNCLAYGSPNTRDGSIALLPTIMYCDDAGYQEVRGELKGWMILSGVGAASESWITVSGTDEKFFAIKHASSNNNTFAYGPVPVE